MQDHPQTSPKNFIEILDATLKSGFDQLSDSKLGCLLSTLAATKPGGRFLELGTGSGISTSWLLMGMDSHSSLISIDENTELVDIAQAHLGHDSRVEFITGKGEDLITNSRPGTMDLIFADTWPGKYHNLEETLSLLKLGGLYIIDDMLPQDNWPEGHDVKASNLIQQLENREDFLLTKMNWSTGIVICTKTA